MTTYRQLTSSNGVGPDSPHPRRWMTVNGDSARSDVPVLLVDDFALNRQCLTEMLSKHYSDVRCAWDMPTFLHEIERQMPRLLLIDIGALETTNLIQMALDVEPDLQVIVYGLSQQEDVTACAEAGASGLLLRSEPVEQLLVLMKEVANGNPWCSKEVSAMLIGPVYSGIAGWSPTGPEMDSLTTREREILLLIEQGLSNQQIASRIDVSLHTVKNHVHSLLSKLGVASRAEASRLFRATKYSSPAVATPQLARR